MELSAHLSQSAVDFMSSFREIFELLTLLTPRDVMDARKIRLGPPGDGGYVVLDRVRAGQYAFSYGPDEKNGFVGALVERGFVVFHRGAAGGDPRTDIGLGADIEQVVGDAADLLLKLDLNGAEWAVLAKTPVIVLRRFEQIIVRFHFLSRIVDQAWRLCAHHALASLAQHFTLFHVHASNRVPIRMVEGFLVPDLLEASFVRTDTVQARPSATFYPTALDAPNDGDRRDHLLWFFPFVPTGWLSAERAAEAQAGTIGRMEQQPAQTVPAAPLPSAPPKERALKILHVSVHPVLEYDEIRLFESMGHQVFSLGFFSHRSEHYEQRLRPALPETDWHRELLLKFAESGCFMHVSGDFSPRVSDAFCRAFDVIVVDHNTRFIVENWNVIAGRPVIWRTIGQGYDDSEDAMRRYRTEGLKIVRWSPAEREIPRHIGEDAVIRACKDPDDWGGWIGQNRRIVTFNNNFSARGEQMNFAFHHEAVSGLPFDLYGLGNDDLPSSKGVATYEQQQDILRSYRVCFTTGSRPAPYTLGFVEAWMTGIPVVHLGHHQFSNGQPGTYEIDRLIVDGESGFLVNDVPHAQRVFRSLLNDAELARAVSARAREAAIQYFGQERAKAEWAAFFRQHVG